MAVWLVLTVTACGKSKEEEKINAYRDSMTSCYENIASSASALDAINPSANSAVNDMLTQLDQMNTAFQDMAALEVPEEYSSIESMADDAAYYMSEASRLYHEAFADGGYQPDVGNSAKLQFKAAMTYLSYIGDILMGEVPEGEEVTVTITY
ncbi:MAG: hypothetical protein K2K20_02025 [Lachnospiraceae bacterium]|nr:hypothetical protein [Lachnospiraceae bacterium]